MNRRRLLAAMLSAPLAACAADEALVPVRSKPKLQAEIDSDPLSLLPSGALLMWRIDGPALFATTLGAHVTNIMTSLLPLGPESGFSPARDIQRVYGALYAMQGADTCAVFHGNFNTAAMEQAAQVKARAPGGQVVETYYADHAIYTVGNLGFVILTPGVLLAGDETGLRRALDRLRYGERARELPKWMHQLFADQSAPFVIGGEIREHPAVAAAQERVPFVEGLQLVRALGNFEAPGLNIVGNLSYRDEPTAAHGAESILEMRKMAYLLSMFASLGAGGGSAPEIQTQQRGPSVAFATSIETQLAVLVLSLVNKLLQPGSNGSLF